MNTKMEQNSEILSRTQCEKVIKHFTKATDSNIESFTVTPLKNQFDGLIAQQCILKVKYNIRGNKHDAQFFLKILDKNNKVMFQISREINAYEKEAFFYDQFCPLLKSKELTCNYAPKSFLCEPYVIVLEDLNLSSYKGTAKNKNLDLPHCQKCLETLAEFHVAPIIYDLVKTRECGKNYSFYKEFSEILEDKILTDEDNGATRFMKYSVQGLFQLIDLIPENGVDRNAFRMKLQEVLGRIMSQSGKKTGLRSTLLHGDLWANNFLYRYGDDDKVIEDCKLIDFQTITFGPPALDVMKFVLGNTRKTFRELHQEELLTYYYDYFCMLLERRGYESSEILSKNEFRDSCDTFKVTAKLFVVVDRCITFMSDEALAEAARSDESFSKFLFEDRGKYIVQRFQENSIFRELMTEDMYELRDMLFV